MRCRPCRAVRRRLNKSGEKRLPRWSQRSRPTEERGLLPHQKQTRTSMIDTEDQSPSRKFFFFFFSIHCHYHPNTPFKPNAHHRATMKETPRKLAPLRGNLPRLSSVDAISLNMVSSPYFHRDGRSLPPGFYSLPRFPEVMDTSFNPMSTS